MIEKKDLVFTEKNVLQNKLAHLTRLSDTTGEKITSIMDHLDSERSFQHELYTKIMAIDLRLRALDV